MERSDVRDPGDLDDAELGHVIGHGAVIGIPLIFLVSLLAALPGAGWPEAPAIAVWPALVGGPFFGGFGAMLLALRSHEPHGTVTALPPRASAGAPGSKAA